MLRRNCDGTDLGCPPLTEARVSLRHWRWSLTRLLLVRQEARQTVQPPSLTLSASLRTGEAMKDANQLLGNFLPLSLLSRIHGNAGTRPAAVEFPAAVLFVDVSRYTALVEQLARRGQEGLEKISTLLSSSYGRCADQICNRGGEVLYFEGDSLVAYWPAEGDDLGSAVRAAVDCADAICSTAQNVRTGETD